MTNPPILTFCYTLVVSVHREVCGAEGLRAGAKRARIPGFDAMSRSKTKYDCIHESITDSKTPLTSAEQNTGLKLDRLQAQAQIGNLPSHLIRELVKRCMVLLGDQRRTRAASNVKTKMLTTSPLDGGGQLMIPIL